MALKKICRWHGCHKLVDYAEQYCDVHKDKAIEQRKKYWHDRDKKIKQNKKQYKYKQFYKSKAWLRVRELLIRKYMCIDVLEYYRTGRIVEGQTVHHIVTLDDDWSKRLDVDNLIYLAESNHRHIHALYDKDYKTKKDIQKVLYGLLNKFQNEFLK